MAINFINPENEQELLFGAVGTLTSVADSLDDAIVDVRDCNYVTAAIQYDPTITSEDVDFEIVVSEGTVVGGPFTELKKIEFTLEDDTEEGVVTETIYTPATKGFLKFETDVTTTDVGSVKTALMLIKQRLIDTV